MPVLAVGYGQGLFKLFIVLRSLELKFISYMHLSCKSNIVGRLDELILPGRYRS